MNTQVNGVLITGAQGITGSQGANGAQGAQGKNGIQGVSNILPFQTGKNISSAFLCSQSAVIGLSGNVIYATPFLPAFNANYNALSIFIALGAPSALGKILIYDDLNGVPNNLLFESSNIDASTTGKKTVNTSGTFLAGVTYYLCLWISVNAVQTRATLASSVSSIRLSTNTPLTYYRRTVTYGSAPNPFGAVQPVTSNPPLIVITLN